MSFGLKNFPLTGIPTPADASAVILWTRDGRYFVQERDDIPGIYFPGHFGFFGGAAEGEEGYEACAIRELIEEVGLDLTGRLETFCSVGLGFEPSGYGRIERKYFTTEIQASETENIVVHEGARAVLIDGADLLSSKPVVPYDAFVLWQHLNLLQK